MDNYEWVAVFKDGHTVKQSKELSSSEKLDKSEVVELRLEPTEPGLKSVSITVDLEKGERFIRFWRRLNKVAIGAAKDLPYGFKPGMNTINIAGIQKADGSKVYLFVRPDGSVRLSTNDLGE